MASFSTEAHPLAFHELFYPEAISSETQAVNEGLVATLASLSPPGDLVGMRDAYSRGLLGVPASPKSSRARQTTIPGPADPLHLRILVPDEVRGVYLHLHGGGWMVGSNDTWDQQLELFGREAGMATVSINYRLAPEHVFPAAVDDCVATAAWLIEHAQEEFGVNWLAIGGESAGANLAASTLVRLRDIGRVEPFRAANLLFGCYDLSLSPSVRSAVDAPFVNRAAMEQFAATFGGGIDLRNPAISPLYADLHGLPPALFTVGSVDPLLDDSLFMNMRWQAAGNISKLAVFPGGTHGFNSMDSELARAANQEMARFLGACVNG